jgi:surface antigen
MNEQRARENSAYVRKLLSEREPEFAAALAAAERYISWSSRPGGDEDRTVTPLQRFRYGHAVLRRETVDVDGHA